MSSNFIDYSKKLSAKSVEVAVIGGGPAGIAAAIASARNGAETLLIERYGFVRGAATAGSLRVMSYALLQTQLLSHQQNYLLSEHSILVFR